ncbi:retinoblastoma-related protein-like isoform X2 [Phoenix dactylifera]|uniref:Retinoblastoma-related protein-like isoform X2 n=1 Tax=Phoenix dactylifera TaxID=42345 RepID=A0A8B7CDW6_PHODC|nr:retinoblastoma-related protein-like isoform X2 [Phoenix dactylifera]
MGPGSMDVEASNPPASSSTDDGGGQIEARFADLCKELALGQSMERQGMAAFKESKKFLSTNMPAIGNRSPEEMERYWSAFVLYCVTRLGKGEVKEEKEGGRITLCKILRAAKLNVVAFFKEVPQLSLKASRILSGLYGSDWEKRLELKELQENVAQLMDLSRFYNKAYKEFFLLKDVSNAQQTEDSRSAQYVSDCYRFGWLLFLALRIHSVSHFNLVTCTNGLVSILAILVLHMPKHFRNFTIQDSVCFVKRSDKGVNLLASLCDKYHTSEDELRRMVEKTNELITDILKKQPCPASECKTENLDHINTDGLTYFEDLLEGKSLQSSLLMLEQYYDDAVNNKCELDERMFVNDKGSLLGTENLSGGAMGSCSMRWKFDAFASPARTMTSLSTPPHSPTSPLSVNYISSSKLAPVTPVSTAMTTAKWLRDVISPLPPKPSAELERFLSSCHRDVTNEITRRANVILEAVFSSNSFGERCVSGSIQSVDVIDRTWAKERKMEALKLYYRILEAICRAESQLLKTNNLSSLLSNERFHRCMLACSSELVLATHRTVVMMFPAVLEVTGLTAFDLSKVIETFVRHEETLPRELKRHLNSLEERLLESMAWEKGSSLYNSLIIARPDLAAEINRLGLLAEPMPSLDAIAVHHNIPYGGLPPLSSQKFDALPDQNGDARSPKRICGEYRSVLVEHSSFSSPGKERLLTFNCLRSKLAPLQSTFASPSQPSPTGEGETCAETGIKVFYSKILKLAAIRIRSLSERLQLSQQFSECMYCLIQRILYQRTALFFNRHIDQLILCSFYGVAKVLQLGLTFKNIVNNYRKQPQCKPQVFQSIFVNWPSANHNGRMVQEHVDIITFYNEIFIPTVKPLLVELAPARDVTEDKNNANGPGSPKLSSFPNLPDMSPKKVSATHNVYVSPLRQSKMDALLSPSSRSYYACIGESTHAYRSPSSDLAAINDRLNSYVSGSCRRINSRLNFDLVSDSMVGGALGHPNGTLASSAAPATPNFPVKREQPDS